MSSDFNITVLILLATKRFLLICSFFKPVYHYSHYISWKVLALILRAWSYLLQKCCTFLIKSIKVSNELSNQNQYLFLQLDSLSKTKDHFLLLKLMLFIRNRFKYSANSKKSNDDRELRAFISST